MSESGHGHGYGHGYGEGYSEGHGYGEGYGSGYGEGYGTGIKCENHDRINAHWIAGGWAAVRIFCNE